MPVTYTPSCDHWDETTLQSCGWYGRGVADADMAQREADMHQAETGHTEVSVAHSGSED